MKKIILIVLFSSIFGFASNNKKIVVFVFCGHSNMVGTCSPPDTCKSKNIYIFNESKNKFDRYHPFIHGNPVGPFLEAMAKKNKNIKICALMMAKMGSKTYEIVEGEPVFDKFKRCVELLKKNENVQFGGVVSMYGLAEALKSKLVYSFSTNMGNLIFRIRNVIGDENLPVLLGRFEIYGGIRNKEFIQSMANQMDTIIKKDKNVKLVPRDFIPSEFYCDDNHYSKNGYSLWCKEAVEIFYENKFNRW